MNAIINYLTQSRDAVQAAIDDPAFCNTIAAIVELTAMRSAAAASCCSPAMAAAPATPSTSPANSCRGSITTARPRRRWH